MNKLVDTVPDGYALISIDALKAWGKYDEVRNACQFPAEQAEQVAVLDITYGREPECYATPNAEDLPEGTYRLYAAKYEQAEQEPLMITPGGGAFPFAVVGEIEQTEQEPVADYNPLSVFAKECVLGAYTFDELPDAAALALKRYAAPVRTKDLTDDELRLFFVANGDPKPKKCHIDAIRAAVAAYREKNR